MKCPMCNKEYTDEDVLRDEGKRGDINLKRANRIAAITATAIAILAVCLFMALTSGCEDKVDSPIAIGGPDGTPCGQGYCRVEYENGKTTEFTCEIHETELIIVPVSDPNLPDLITITTAAVSDAPPVWGKGELPPHWVEYFGDDNGARLDFKQSQIIDELAKRVITLEINQYIPDPNGVK